MTETPLHWLTISELSQRIRQGVLSPVELTEHMLSRLEALDGTLHAFKLVAREPALAQAQAAELTLKAGQDVGPLHGIPYAAKDLFDVKGLPTTAGSSLLEHNIAAADATVIRRLTQAGMVLLGKTHTVQFAYGGVGINHHHGTPHNPWHAVSHVIDQDRDLLLVRRDREAVHRIRCNVFDDVLSAAFVARTLASRHQRPRPVSEP